jgi:hypothetical protein
MFFKIIRKEHGEGKGVSLIDGGASSVWEGQKGNK